MSETLTNVHTFKHTHLDACTSTQGEAGYVERHKHAGVSAH